MISNIKIFFLLFLFSPIFPYLTFPLYNDDYNFTSLDTPKEIIEKLLNSKLYININVGSEKAIIKSYLVLDRTEFMIAGQDIKNHKYNELISNSYNCSYCKNTSLYYGLYSKGILSTEDFHIENDKNETIIINNMKFILGTESSSPSPPEGFIGLHLPYFDSLIEFNFIISLKKANATNSYYWYLNFGNKSKMIVDGFPHDLNSTKYNSKKFVTSETINGGYFLIWGLNFTDIYYNNSSNRIIEKEEQKTAKILFDYGLILAPDEAYTFLEKKFFEEYFQKNICFKETLGNYKESFIYCKNTKEFNIKEFKSIYFKSIALNTIFELNYEDLFFYKDDYVYFLMLFKGVTWAFGELFLKKYYLVFNQDEKTISYYENIDKENNDDYQNPNNKNYTNVDNKNGKFKLKDYFILILLFLILISIIFVGIIVYTKNGKRKNRANELNDDDYEYNSSINANEEANKKILDN